MTFPEFSIAPYLPYIFGGFAVMMQLLFMTVVITVTLAFLFGLARMSRNPFLRLPVSAVVELFRGTPVLVQLFWAFYVLPFFGVQLSPIWAAALVIGLNQGSYSSEIVRGAINSVPAGQWEAARVLGYAPVRAFRTIIFPQAVALMIPPFTNIFISLNKFTALASLVTLTELTSRALSVRATTGSTTEVFLLIMVLYFAISMLIAYGMGKLDGWVGFRFGAKAGRPAQLKEATT